MPRLVGSGSQHLVPLARVALLVALGDYLTKVAAAAFLAHEPTIVASWLRLVVIHNDQGAFGISLGAYTWQLNLALTLSAVALMVPVSRDLARIDRLAPYALGLIVGGAVGNLTSLILSSPGVVDFIAVRWTASAGLVLNVADVAAYTGLAMICRTGFLIVERLREDARSPQLERATPRDFAVFSIADREVDRVVHREPAPLAARAAEDVPRPMSHDGRRSRAARPRTKGGIAALRLFEDGTTARSDNVSPPPQEL